MDLLDSLTLAHKQEKSIRDGKSKILGEKQVELNNLHKKYLRVIFFN